MTDKTQWFSDWGWGVFCHYLGSPPSTHGSGMTAGEWNRQDRLLSKSSGLFEAHMKGTVDAFPGNRP